MFRRTARALTTNLNIPFDQWMDELRVPNEGSSPSHTNRVAKTLLRKCDPNQYLLSHTTIVASVDTFEPKKASTGRRMNRGVEIDVRYPNYRIKPECHEIINNNGDAWDRSLLLSTYKTFVGAPVYLEHIQIPELSKGFIVDAIARDLGHSVYVDILMATDRKHKKLVNDILSGEIYGASMGCISLFTVCTKCGNVASDDVQLCPCVMYDGKGTTFASDGIQHPLAELIGHISVPNSNQFIEASWVKSPAFRGAVKRNLLNPEVASDDKIAARVEESGRIHSVRVTQPLPVGQTVLAASRFAEDEQAPADQGPADQGPADQGQGQDPAGQGQGQGQGQGDPTEFETQALGDDLGPPPSGGGGGGGGLSDQGQGQGDQAQAPGAGEAPTEDKFSDLVTKIEEAVLQGIVEKLLDRVGPKPADVGYADAGSTAPGVESYNTNLGAEFSRKLRHKFAGSPRLIDWAERTHRIVRIGGRKSITANKLTASDLVVFSWVQDKINAGAWPDKYYKAAMATGAMKSYPSERSYLATCSVKLGKKLLPKEKQFFLRKGKISNLTPD